MSEKKPEKPGNAVMSRRGVLRGLAGVAAHVTGLAPKVPVVSTEALPVAEAAAAVAISPARLLSFIIAPKVFKDINYFESLESYNLKQLIHRAAVLVNLIEGIPENADLFSLEIQSGGVHHNHDTLCANMFAQFNPELGFSKEKVNSAEDGSAEMIFKYKKVSSFDEVMQRLFPGRTSITPAEIRSFLSKVLTAKLDKPINEIIQEIRSSWDTKNEEFITENLKSIERVCEDLQLPEQAKKISVEVNRRENLQKEEREEIDKKYKENTKIMP